MATSAGRVLPLFKGTYSSSTSYSMLDVVLYNGSSYIAKKATSGYAPTNTTYWQLLAQKGADGSASSNLITGVKGDNESSYRTGNVNITKSNIGLGNVENKSSSTIRGELTKSNVTSALGYTPPTSDTTALGSMTGTLGVAHGGTGETTLDNVYVAGLNTKGYGINLDNATVMSGTVTNLGTFSLTPGLWIVEAVAFFQLNTSGYRQLSINLASSSSNNMDRYSTIKQIPLTTGETVAKLISLVSVTSTNTYATKVYQNSGSSLTCSGGIRAFRISKTAGLNALS